MVKMPKEYPALDHRRLCEIGAEFRSHGVK